MRKLSVLFNTSRGSFTSPGGGEVQMLETKKELEKRGHKVKVLEEGGEVDFGAFDVFHNFNIHRDNLELVTRAKRAGLPVAVSTIYWPSLKSAVQWNKGLGKVKALGAEMISGIPVPGIDKAGEIVRQADVLLPNSRAEAAVLGKKFGVAKGKIHVVPNGVDKRFKSGKPGLFEKKFGLRDFVLYVGRVEERKNVLGLVRAMKGTGKKLVVIGNAKKGSEAYMQECRKEAGSNVVFLGSMPHEGRLLESAYAACRVFALPSMYETPGLAALEAGLAGANVVVTKEGCAKEYFGKWASYVDPLSVGDVRGKVFEALEKQKGMGKELSRHIEKNFLWENAALETERAYGKILGE